MQITNSIKMAKLATYMLLSLSLYIFAICNLSHANQMKKLHMFLNSRRSHNAPIFDSWAEEDASNDYSPVYIGPQEGMMQADKIHALPGQPENGVNFNQYAGYVTVDPHSEKALFYYFAESPEDSSTKPLVLWLNGGPGCSSFGIGAMTELGPFRVNSDNKTLFWNKYAWNTVANVIFLESPAGVGFSYSNSSVDYNRTGDSSTAKDTYTFLVNWLERFPQYKTRDFYITGESYAGHYVPQLAYTIFRRNKKANKTIINLKGVAIGNAYIDSGTYYPGYSNYVWTHALNSDETYKSIGKYCKFGNGIDPFTKTCEKALLKSFDEVGNIDYYNIYAPICENLGRSSTVSVENFDPCSDVYVNAYLNTEVVQKAIHAKLTTWSACGGLNNWTDSPDTVLPIFEKLIASGIKIWLYSGDFDAVVSVTTTRYAINSLKLPVAKAWRPWYSENEVGGYVEEYKGITFVTVRGAGHLVPSYQPRRALTMISSFLSGTLPPSSP